MVKDPIIRDGGDRDNCRSCFRLYYVILVHPYVVLVGYSSKMQVRAKGTSDKV